MCSQEGRNLNGPEVTLGSLVGLGPNVVTVSLPSHGLLGKALTFLIP